MAQQIVGVSYVKTIQPTTSTGAYASGDRLGTEVYELDNVFSEAASAWLTEVTVIDEAKQSAAMTMLLFQASPTVASADNAPIDITDAEMRAKCIAAIPLDASYVALANNSVQTTAVKRHLMCRDLNQKKLYVVFIINAAATYGTTSLTFQLNFVNG